MRYRVIVHAPGAGVDEHVLARLRSVLEQHAVPIGVLRTEEGPHANPLIYLSSELEAPSSYHVKEVTGRDLFRRVFDEAGLTLPEYPFVLEVERA